MLLQSRFDSKFLRKKYCKYFTTVIFLLPFTFSDVVFAKDMNRYIKGLGAKLREHPKISSKVLTKLSRGTKVLSKETKGLWEKVEVSENQGWLMSGQISDIPVGIKKSILSQKIRLQSSSGKRVRLRTFTALVGVKGLVDKKGQKISPYKTDYLALEWLEKQPTDEENSVQFVTFSE